jgi:hypothetical protein
MFSAETLRLMGEVRQLFVERDAYRTALETLLTAATAPTWTDGQYDVLPLNAEGQPIGRPERVDVAAFLAVNREWLVDRPEELVRLLRLPAGEVWPTGGGAGGGFLVRRCAER